MLLTTLVMRSIDSLSVLLLVHVVHSLAWSCASGSGPNESSKRLVETAAQRPSTGAFVLNSTQHGSTDSTSAYLIYDFGVNSPQGAYWEIPCICASPLDRTKAKVIEEKADQHGEDEE